MNPFRYSEPVPPAEMIDREAEAGLLIERAEGGNNSRLIAPRRYGKTSLLRRAAADARSNGWAAVYVDFFGVLTLGDVAQRIEREYTEQLEGGLRSWFAGARRMMMTPTVRAGGGPVPASIEVSADPQPEPPLLERLALPRRLHEQHGTRTLVIFDEFQDLLATRQRADAVFRSEIQHHGDAASYVFAGSQVGMMRELFSDRRRAFYGQAGPVLLPPLPPEDVAEDVSRRFEATGRDVGGALDPLLALAAGHPQRTMLLAHALWELTEPGSAASTETWLDASDQVMRDSKDELRAVWSGLPAGQRRTLAAIADGDKPLYAASRSHGGSRGGAVKAATAALEDRGEIVPDDATGTGYRLVDPLLRAWVREGRAGD